MIFLFVCCIWGGFFSSWDLLNEFDFELRFCCFLLLWLVGWLVVPVFSTYWSKQ
jgi:hypothetical protein